MIWGCLLLGRKSKCSTMTTLCCCQSYESWKHDLFAHQQRWLNQCHLVVQWWSCLWCFCQLFLVKISDPFNLRMDYVKQKPEENDVPIRNPFGCSAVNPGIYGNLSSVSDPNLLFFSFWGSFDPFRERHDPWGYATGKSQTLSGATRFLLWWFQIFDFQPYLGKIPILANMFQMGWNHQLVFVNGFTIIQSPSLVDGKT